MATACMASQPTLWGPEVISSDRFLHTNRLDREEGTLRARRAASDGPDPGAWGGAKGLAVLQRGCLGRGVPSHIQASL